LRREKVKIRERRDKMRKRSTIDPGKADREAYRRLLEEHGYTKMSIAKILGISKQAITRWEEIPLKHVKKLSEATGIRKADLRPSDFA
jgi:ParB-like chromosome segregation protein Spo0J